MPTLYNYRAELVRVIDGDTIDLEIDLGFGIFARQIVRLHGINAPEMKSPDGAKTKLFVSDWCLAQSPLVIETFKDSREKYGRLLARIHGRNGQVLNQVLLDNKLAAAYQ